jgi:hypothetical protein
MKLGESGNLGRSNMFSGYESGNRNACRVGVAVADRLNKNVGDMGNIPTAHIDPMGETTNPGDIA